MLSRLALDFSFCILFLFLFDFSYLPKETFKFKTVFFCLKGILFGKPFHLFVFFTYDFPPLFFSKECKSVKKCDFLKTADFIFNLLRYIPKNQCIWGFRFYYIMKLQCIGFQIQFISSQSDFPITRYGFLNLFCHFHQNGCALGSQFQERLRSLRVKDAATKISIKTMSGSTTEESRSVNNLVVSAPQNSEIKICLPKTYSRSFIPVDKDEIPTPNKVKRWKYLDVIHPFLATRRRHYWSWHPYQRKLSTSPVTGPIRKEWARCFKMQICRTFQRQKTYAFHLWRSNEREWPQRCNYSDVEP